ncbi:MAG: hypothetical protein IT374_22095 [Polyangiaceae bacterium]|nr:hypothetical protein [Polyangiaceae bacterium]
MTYASRCLFALLSLPLAAACGGSDSGGDDAAAGPSKQTPQFVAAPNGKAISEAQACERVREAQLKGCTLSQAICPTLLRNAYPLGDSKYNCSTWDEGVVKSCEDYLATLSCEDRVNYPCKLVYFEKTGTGQDVCDGAGGAGGAAGAGGSSAGAGGSSAGAGGSSAGAGGSSAGAGGSSAGAGGSSAGAGGSSAGAGGSSAGAGGSSAGAGGSSAGAGGAAAGAGGSSAGASGSAGAGG